MFFKVLLKLCVFQNESLGIAMRGHDCTDSATGKVQKSLLLAIRAGCLCVEKVQASLKMLELCENNCAHGVRRGDTCERVGFLEIYFEAGAESVLNRLRRFCDY